jgi:acetyltransferase-like isoleucine patch superfamily enzyme
MSVLIVQSVVCGLAMLPVAAMWVWLAPWSVSSSGVRVVVAGALVIPSYILFALTLMLVSAIATRVVGLRTPPDAEMRIAEMNWQLMKWVQHMVAIHLVRVFAGTIFRGTPLWTAYIRMNGARIGRRVYINSLFISDHNLIEFGDDVVIGAEAHISGHTVEAGVVKTGRVRLEHDVTIGLGSVVEIGATVGACCQVGALSFVPKHAVLPGGTVYAGIPVERIG